MYILQLKYFLFSSGAISVVSNALRLVVTTSTPNQTHYQGESRRSLETDFQR